MKQVPYEYALDTITNAAREQPILIPVTLGILIITTLVVLYRSDRRAHDRAYGSSRRRP